MLSYFKLLCNNLSLLDLKKKKLKTVPFPFSSNSSSPNHQGDGVAQASGEVSIFPWNCQILLRACILNILAKLCGCSVISCVLTSDYEAFWGFLLNILHGLPVTWVFVLFLSLNGFTYAYFFFFINSKFSLQLQPRKHSSGCLKTGFLPIQDCSLIFQVCVYVCMH